MKTVQRFDFHSLPTMKPIKTDAGFLRLPIRATRVGVFEYVQPDGSIRKELRPPEEVFAEDSMSTLAAVPITVRHPNEPVTTKNVRGLSIGMIGDSIVKAEDRFLDTVGTVTDERMVTSLEAKRDRGEGQEVSCGYTAEMDFTPGVWNGIHYDAIQRKIRYNHVAFVDRGRAGPEVRVRLDECDNAFYSINEGDSSMKTIKIDGKEFEVKEDVAEAVEGLQTKLSEAKSDAKGMKAKMEEDEEEMKKMKKEKDQMEAKKDSLETEVASLKKNAEKKLDHNEIDTLVQERADVCDVAKEIITDFKKDGKSNLDIKKEVISAMSPDLKLDEKSEDYINARFDAIAEKKELHVDHLKKVMEAKADEDGNGTKETKVDADEARAKMINDSQEAWKKPLNEK